MNKGEMIDQLAQKHDLSKTKAREIVESLFDANEGMISGALKKGDKVTIPGFGTFEARKRAARTGRNPATGKEIEIAASTSPAFKAGKGMKDAVTG